MMTPERWQQIGDVFEAAVQIAPDSREEWVRTACAGDDDLRVEVNRLLAQDEQADREGFLTLTLEVADPLGATGPWPARPDHQSSRSPGRDGPGQDGGDATPAFMPRAVLGPPSDRASVVEPPDIVRARLRELPIVYILLLVNSILWRYFVIGSEDMTLYRVDAVLIGALVGTLALLWSPRPIPLVWLKAIELGMVGMLAARIAFVQFRLILYYSRPPSPDVMLAQLTLKNVVLLTSVLIMIYGLYVPKTWRRAAVVVIPLALMPYLVLLALIQTCPQAMEWLWKGWSRQPNIPRIRLLFFDAPILLIVAAVSTFGARTLSRLRRQAALARQLGQYHLRQRIGAGGMGEVYLAEHQLLKRPCAVKLIKPAEAAEPRALQRFEREVQLTATLSHPNTVEIYDYGQAEDGTYYYVMEYMRGLSLAELVARYGPLPPGRAVYLLRQVCGALREAHAAGLIHRDIKPSNIFAARRGGVDDVAKLLDFGLVRPVTAARRADLSEEGQILGTPLFMSPEQATATRELDERSDIYSLGAVAYHLLTGKPPFNTGGAIEVMIALAREPVVPPAQIRDDVPADLDRVVVTCLAKDPADRFPDAASLERALGECLCAQDWGPAQATRWWKSR
jgi:serine/threonine-protein kinase